MISRQRKLLMKEKFFNLKVYHTPNKNRENSNKKNVKFINLSVIIIKFLLYILHMHKNHNKHPMKERYHF